MSQMNKKGITLKMYIVSAIISMVISSLFSCSGIDIPYASQQANELIDGLVDSIDVQTPPYGDWVSTNSIRISRYAPLAQIHQSAAVYGDYAFIWSVGKSKICLYNLKKKELLFSIENKSSQNNYYHCNQCSFGIDKYDPSDPFPLLYVSQFGSKTRSLIEVYRIKPLFDDFSSDYKSFEIEIVQTIFLPETTLENCLWNVNCIINSSDGLIYTYSHNHNKEDTDYLKCRITLFGIPDFHKEHVEFNSQDIISYFSADFEAGYMQGACIKDEIMYIGQGGPAVGIYFNVIDLNKKELVKRFDLQQYGVNWEPEGCFFYDGSVMLSHSGGIMRIEK